MCIQPKKPSTDCKAHSHYYKQNESFCLFLFWKQISKKKSLKTFLLFDIAQEFNSLVKEKKESKTGENPGLTEDLLNMTSK
jgi:hypothetical protein